MRTSPSHMRPWLRRVVAVTAAGCLALTAASCGDDDQADPPPPSTTSPETPADGGDETTTTTAGNETDPPATAAPETPTTPEEPDGTEPPSSGAGLTPIELEEVVTQLMGRYREALATAKASNDDGEVLLASLGDTFSGSAARDQLDGLRTFGGLAVVAPQPAVPEVGAATVEEASAACVSGTVRVRIDPMFTKAVPANQPYSVRLLPAPAGSPAPAWRLDYFSFSSTDDFLEVARCPA